MHLSEDRGARSVATADAHRSGNGHWCFLLLLGTLTKITYTETCREKYKEKVMCGLNSETNQDCMVNFLCNFPCFFFCCSLIAHPLTAGNWIFCRDTKPDISFLLSGLTELKLAVQFFFPSFRLIFLLILFASSIR